MYSDVKAQSSLDMELSDLGNVVITKVNIKMGKTKYLNNCYYLKRGIIATT